MATTTRSKGKTTGATGRGTNGSRSRSRKPKVETPVETTPVETVVETETVAAPVVRTAADLVGTVEDPKPDVAELLERLQKLPKKEGEWTLKASKQPELLLQRNGKTVAYLARARGGGLHVRQHMHGLKLQGTDTKRLADDLLAFLHQRDDNAAAKAAADATA